MKSYLVHDLDSGNICPACPTKGSVVCFDNDSRPSCCNSIAIQEQDALVVSMDGLFGLPQKKSAGSSHRQSLHGHLFFEDQGDVDMFVREAHTSKNVVNVSV